MGCNSSKQQDVAKERERAPAASLANKQVNKAAKASAASPIRPAAPRQRERDDGPYELGKTPSDQHQREEDSFQELILRTQVCCVLFVFFFFFSPASHSLNTAQFHRHCDSRKCWRRNGI